MELSLTHLDHVVTVAPKGRIDSTTAKQFGDRLHDVITGGCRHVIIDFQNVQYISSAGFRSLLVADAHLQETAGSLALCGMRREVQRLFEIGAFTDNFMIFSTVDECIARLNSSAGGAR